MRYWRLLRWALLVSSGLLIVLVYAPALTGGFVFDDVPNIVRNSHIAQVDSFQSAWQAGFTNMSGPLGRPVAMLTFAVNVYFTGLDPWWMKLTNLAIHLLNTGLVFLLAIRLVPLLSRSPLDMADARWLAVAIALIWAIHPLNLTSVAYIIQRINSLATLFSLLAILSYLRARMATYPRQGAVPNHSILPPSAYYGFFLTLCYFNSDYYNRYRNICFTIYQRLPV